MNKKYKIAYCTPSLYMAGGIERVLTTKANYFADVLDYDIYIILTDGKGKTPFYKLSDKINLINLDIKFEELWKFSFTSKIPIYIKKQHKYKQTLTRVLYEIKPDITVSLLRREINFITKINDGSKKIGELHVNKANYRNFESSDINFIKKCFSEIWMKQLIKKIKKLDKFVVLTKEDLDNWIELNNTICIPDPLTSSKGELSNVSNKNVIAVGRYVYQKGFDLLLQAWQIVNKRHPDWTLSLYGGGKREPYIKLAKDLNIEYSCKINAAVSDINTKFAESSILAFSSRFEGFGMVIIEAMTCGVPTVSFTCPCGPKDIIRNEINGLLIDNGNINEFAEGICRLIEDVNLRKELSDQCKKDAAIYQIDNLAQKWIEVFDEIIEEKRKEK